MNCHFYPSFTLYILHQYLKIKRVKKSVHSSYSLCMQTLGQEPLKMGDLLLVQGPQPLYHTTPYRKSKESVFLLSFEASFLPFSSPINFIVGRFTLPRFQMHGILSTLGTVPLWSTATVFPPLPSFLGFLHLTTCSWSMYFNFHT